MRLVQPAARVVLLWVQAAWSLDDYSTALIVVQVDRVKGTSQ